MSALDLYNIEPFEISSIRPPTENNSLSFRITRNCYWNKCGFCPVYKTGLRFSRRPLEEVKDDVSRAKSIDDTLLKSGFGIPVYSEADFYKASSLIEDIKRHKWEAGILTDEPDNIKTHEDMDERMKWFMSWFKDKPVLEDSIYHLISWRIGGAKTCFLGDADSLILKPDFLHNLMSHIKANFPTLQRFTVYGRTKTAAQNRTLDELKEFHIAGINRVHFGLESGSNKVLTLINKGVTASQHIDGCLKTKEAGLSCSIYVMPGLGGSALSNEHALETARVINVIEPDFVRLRTLEIFPATPLEEMRKSGNFIEATEDKVAHELRTLIENINCNTEILSDSASNLLDVHGRLPDDKTKLLNIIDDYLNLDPREKIEFSFNSRLRSFVGQYGSLSDDLIQAIMPYINNNTINFSVIDISTLKSLIHLIRSKLMP